MIAEILLGLVLILFAIVCYKLIIKLTTGICKSSVCLEGKTAIITGANTGCGYETALDFAKRGARVILACKNEKKAKEVVRKIIEQTNNNKVTYKIVDLASFNSVRKFAAHIKATENRLDILINNAGTGAIPNELTEDGLPPTMQINYLSHFLLTNLLMDLLKKNRSRIVNVSSIVAQLRGMKFTELTKSSNFFNEYVISKLCQIIFTVEFARRHVGTNVTIYSVHPGVANTEAYRHLPRWLEIMVLIYIRIFLKSPFEAAQTQIHCAVAKNMEIHNGQHFHDCHLVRRYWNARDPEIARRLWEETEKLVSGSRIP